MGAMENWGLVTYRTTAVLFDEGKSDTRYKNRIAYVVAHGEFLSLRHNDCVWLFLRMNRRIGPPVVWQSCDYGLVERALAERRLCNLGWLVGR
jgi:hypothetical protein